jgi:hypothetical protein
MFISSLEDTISPENLVRNRFFVVLSLQTVGFSVQTVKNVGRPFDIKIFLKINLYGYLNGLELKKARKSMLNINCNGFMS